MPRRDVMLTGIIAFAAGCAVGANWPKIRKKIGPMIGKAGLQISELGEFFSESFPESESFFQAAAAHARQDFAASRTRDGRNGSVAAETNGVGTNGHSSGAKDSTSSARVPRKTKSATKSRAKSSRKSSSVGRKRTTEAVPAI